MKFFSAPMGGIFKKGGDCKTYRMENELK